MLVSLGMLGVCLFQQKV
ncbi:hypothetical protein LINGRAHAP2_LOCUS8010 [Linum grandiflorum]